MPLKRVRSSVGFPFVPRAVRLKRGVSRHEAAIIAKRSAIRTSTKKSFKTGLALTVSSSGNQTELSDIAIGTSDFNRVGSGVLPIQITFRWSWRVNSTLATLGCRLLVVRSKLIRGTAQAPAVSEILDLTPNGVAITIGTEHLAGQNLERLSTHDVIWDSGETVINNTAGNENQSGLYHERTMRLETHPQTYTDGGLTANNKFFLVCITNSATSSTLQFGCDIRFIDK